MYPYQNLNLENLPGESWEDIPWLDGLYRISCFGRIKRLEMEIQTYTGQTRYLKPRILRPDITKQENSTVGDWSYFLSGSILYEGKKFKFSIPRLVYYCFIKKFSLEDYSIIVFAKDGDGKHIVTSNLQLADISKKQKRIFDRGRLVRNIETSFDEYVEKGKIKSKNPYCKQVSQFSSKGKYIQTFPSIKVASSISGVSESGIVSVLKGRQLSSGGYLWAYKKVKCIDIAKERIERLEKRNRLLGTKLTQYNLKGKRIAIFFTIADASRKTGVRATDISVVLSGNQRSAGGFIWKKGFGKAEIQVESFLTGNALRIFRKQKMINQYSSKGKYVQTFPSVKEAAKSIGVSAGYISSAIKEGLIVKGFRWKFPR